MRERKKPRNDLLQQEEKKITFEYRTNCDCERERETRGNVEALCDKSIYETSHNISKNEKSQAKENLILDSHVYE